MGSSPSVDTLSLFGVCAPTLSLSIVLLLPRLLSEWDDVCVYSWCAVAWCVLAWCVLAVAWGTCVWGPTLVGCVYTCRLSHRKVLMVYVSRGVAPRAVCVCCCCCWCCWCLLCGPDNGCVFVACDCWAWAWDCCVCGYVRAVLRADWAAAPRFRFSSVRLLEDPLVLTKFNRLVPPFNSHNHKVNA
jgi:hypothetical protein